MRHAWVLLVALLGLYAVWALLPQAQRQRWGAGLRRHGWRLVALVLVVVLGVVWAYHQPALPLMS